jgi:hypothetical protein
MRSRVNIRLKVVNIISGIGFICLSAIISRKARIKRKDVIEERNSGFK